MSDLLIHELEPELVDAREVSSYVNAVENGPQLFIMPATSVPRVAKMLEITHRAAQQNVEKLIEAKILREITGRQRYRIFLADEIIRSIEA